MTQDQFIKLERAKRWRREKNVDSLQWKPENCIIERRHFVYLMLCRRVTRQIVMLLTFQMIYQIKCVQNCCILCLLDYLNSWVGSKSRLPIPELNVITIFNKLFKIAMVMHGTFYRKTLSFCETFLFLLLLMELCIFINETFDC